MSVWGLLSRPRVLEGSASFRPWHCSAGVVSGSSSSLPPAYALTRLQPLTEGAATGSLSQTEETSVLLQESQAPSPGVAAATSSSPAGLNSAGGGISTRRFALPCRLLLTADRLNVDWDLFRAIHEAGLVYDGRLLVEADFCVRTRELLPWWHQPFFWALQTTKSFPPFVFRPTTPIFTGEEEWPSFLATDAPPKRRTFGSTFTIPRKSVSSSLVVSAESPLLPCVFFPLFPCVFFPREQVGFYLGAAVGRRLTELWGLERLPPLGGEFFRRSLLDPRILRPSTESVCLLPLASRTHTTF